MIASNGITRRALSERGGSAAIEFALIFPIGLIFFCGMIAYGLYFSAAHSLQQLAADAARASVGGLDDSERATIARAHVAASGGNYPFLKQNRMAVSAEPLVADPSQFQVRIAFDSRDLPIWVFSGLIPLPEQTIERTAVIARGGF